MSGPERKHCKSQRTPDDLAELRAERAQFSRTRPGPEEVAASGDFDGPYRQGDLLTLLSTLATLRLERERQGLSLADVAGRSGLDKSMLSRLENGKILNPTVTTLWRYADAVGMSLKLSAERVPLGAG